jgi:hypothetical protein
MGAAQEGEQGHAPGVIPSPPLPTLSAPGRTVVEHGMEKKNSSADVRGPVDSGCKRNGETRRHGHRAADAWGQAAAAAGELGARA